MYILRLVVLRKQQVVFKKLLGFFSVAVFCVKTGLKFYFAFCEENFPMCEWVQKRNLKLFGVDRVPKMFYSLNLLMDIRAVFGLVLWCHMTWLIFCTFLFGG